MRCYILAVAVLSALLLAQSFIGVQGKTVTCSSPGNSKTATFDDQAGGSAYCTQLLGDGGEACNSGMAADNLYAEYGSYAGKSASLPSYNNVAFQADKHAQAPIAMIIGQGPTADKAIPLMKAQFWPKTDEFSMIDIKDSFIGGITAATEPYFVKFEFAGFSTPPVQLAKVETNGVEMLYVPYWTVVIKLDKGKVVGIRYDSNCAGCKQECMDGVACPVSMQSCANHEGGLECTLKAYVAWEGTDKNGEYMLSVQRTIRNFRTFSASFAIDVASQIYNKVKNNLPNVPNDWDPKVPSVPWTS